jgi:hypothetical protein
MINDLKDKFDRAGGMETLAQFTRAHVLGYAALQTLLQGTSQKSLEIVRLSVSNRVQKKLRKKYSAYIQEYLKREREKQSARAGKAAQGPQATGAGKAPAAAQPAKKPEAAQAPATAQKLEAEPAPAASQPAHKPGKIWMFWSSGEESAPPIARKCIASIRENLPDREVVVLSEKTYRDYVTFPSFIQEKIDRGEMMKAHMADLLRLELLIRYGGTWIDATVFCPGGKIPAYMLDSDLFLFQDLKPGFDGHCQRISNWMITARAGNPVLKLTRALLYEYWREHRKCEDYFIFHHFFEMAIDAYPELWEKVIPFSNAAPHILLLRLFEPYDDAVWEAVREMTPFHKLSYKFDEAKTQIPGTYYQELFGDEAGRTANSGAGSSEAGGAESQ